MRSCAYGGVQSRWPHEVLASGFCCAALCGATYLAPAEAWPVWQRCRRTSLSAFGRALVNAFDMLNIELSCWMLDEDQGQDI